MWKLLPTPSLFLFVILNFTLLAEDGVDPTGDEASQFKLPVISLLHRSEKYQLKDLATSFALKYLPIIRNSETLSVNGKNSPGIDYQIDYREGAITLQRDFPDNALLKITYQTFPFPIKKLYRRDLFRREALSEEVRPSADRDMILPRRTPVGPATAPSNYMLRDRRDSEFLLEATDRCLKTGSYALALTERCPKTLA